MLKTVVSTIFLGAMLGGVVSTAPAHAQATRTWVSGTGDDANPCSRTAPCKTFAGAISKTANGGEINCIDPGGFGGVTITKSLTIKCHYTEGGVLVSGTNAIVVNAAATDRVTLRGLDINGIGTGAPTSLTGVKVLSASMVELIDVEIYRFKAGVAVVPSTAGVQTNLIIKNSHIHHNDIGVIVAPGNNTVGTVTAGLDNNLISDNVCGVSAGAFGANASTPTTTDCGTSAAAGINKNTKIVMNNNFVRRNSTGLFSRGGNARIEISNNTITSNTSFGIRLIDNGNVTTTSPATNVLTDNAASDPPNLANNLQ
jgi:hypothetical protein